MVESNFPLFILNNKDVFLPNLSKNYLNLTLLDFVRYQQRKFGTKIGCREGDCGACTVIIGEIADGEIRYRNIVSCLTPLYNVIGKHVVTIEGINLENKLTVIQEELVNQGGTQCGACTPGFICSLTCGAIDQINLAYPSKTYNFDMLDYIDGNICRCTGYQSIIKAARNIEKSIFGILENRSIEPVLNNQNAGIVLLVSHGYLPTYFLDIKKRLQTLKISLEHFFKKHNMEHDILVGGGTDLFVQKQFELPYLQLLPIYQSEKLDFIREEDDEIIIGSGTTFTQLMESDVIDSFLDRSIDLRNDFKLIGSSIIRNIGTVGGNIANASPIADLVIYFLALDAQLILRNGNNYRHVPLKEFYLDYKKLDLLSEEIIYAVKITKFKGPIKFNFEKVSRRIKLDIASVNSACLIQLNPNEEIIKVNISVGGVSPIPLLLQQASDYLIGKKIDNSIMQKLLEIVDAEISPITDIRGSEAYKRLLLRQLVIAHFIEMYPDLLMEEILS